MKLRELREALNRLPPGMDEFDVVIRSTENILDMEMWSDDLLALIALDTINEPPTLVLANWDVATEMIKENPDLGKSS